MRELAKRAAWLGCAGAIAAATLATGCNVESSTLAAADTPPLDIAATPPLATAASTPPSTTALSLPHMDVRVSMIPLYQLTPQSELGRFEIFGERMLTSDFQAPFTQVSVEQKVLEIGQQIGQELGVGALDLFIDRENQSRAAEIPFRGNPSDVDFMGTDGIAKAFVPLGGGIMDPGNEVAIVNLNNGNVHRVRVGIHPQRLVAHEPSKLVFVCNQYSSYVSIIDARTNELLRGPDGWPVEVPTDFYCTDLLLVERDPVSGHPDELHLYVANEHRSSVLRYAIDIVRDINDDVRDVQVLPPARRPPHIPDAEILGVGKNPYRLHLNESQTQIYVANQRGGELAVFDIATAQVFRHVALGAPLTDVVQIADKVYAPTTTPFRGLPSYDAAAVPGEFNGDPAEVLGVDGNPHMVHPGALFDQTDSYDFEDLRNGVYQINGNLGGAPDYHTDDNEADEFFAGTQKVLAGAVPWDIERTAAGDRVYVAMLGSDLVQELIVGNGEYRLQPQGGLLFHTGELPAAVALDEAGGRLLVANYGAETLQIFDLDNGQLVANVNLGYANPQYPATLMEAGEYFFASAKWSNDGRKACASCHNDRFLTDGIGYASGTAAPTTYHQVKPTYNLMETDNYNWNGSFVSNNNASLSFAAQSRTNCELILYGLVEGIDSDPATRVGDGPNNYTSGGDDSICRPNVNELDAAGLPISLEGDANGDGVEDFKDIADVIAQQKQIAFQAIGFSVQDQLQRIGRFDPFDGQTNRDEVSRAIDFYTASELRLPPNPLAQMRMFGRLPARIERMLRRGEYHFDRAGCDNCHDPQNANAPFSDGREHGSGAGFMRDFILTYNQDPRLINLDPILANGIPFDMLAASESDFTQQEMNYHYHPLDYFMPFAFGEDSVLAFNNPLSVQGSDEETERLIRLALINLADPDRGFLPGSVIGQPRVNTPSLRGVWLQHNLLRHGLARNLREAVLPPGHVALHELETGLAVDRRGDFDIHGQTTDMSPGEVEALELYVRSIE